MATKKKISKGPFRNHTVEQIAYAESNSYVIQVGVDFYESKGRTTFTRKGAENIYVKVLGSLLHSIDNGNEQDKLIALRCLLTLKVLPLRIQ